jgi:crossover junction endodeoxyribonuclease RusA
MSVEIKFPIEFAVEGTPVSLQAKRRDSIARWKSQIVKASQIVLPPGHFATEAALAITLFYFPAAPMEGDLDNIVKPILDALEKHIYMNDRQIYRILVQKFELTHAFEFASPSPALKEALNTTRPTLYIRLSDDPFEDLPK